MRTPIVASAAAIICIAAGCNRSSPLTSDAVDRSLPTSGAGDPALTVELVSKDVATHKGKRVRWFGHQMSFESTSGGGEQKTMYTYADVAAWQSGGSLHPFVVQMSSQKGEPGKMPSLGDAPMDAWVTGTVAGTHTIGLTRGSPSGSESTSPEIVPLLVYAQFEAKGATKEAVAPAANTPSNEAYYSRGVAAYNRYEAALSPVEVQLHMKYEPGILKDKKVRADLRAKYSPIIDEGIANLNKALEIDKDDAEAMTYLNLLIRRGARLVDDNHEYSKQVEIADRWVEKALDTMKAKTANQPMGTSSKSSHREHPPSR